MQLRLLNVAAAPVPSALPMAPEPASVVTAPEATSIFLIWWVEVSVTSAVVPSGE